MMSISSSGLQRDYYEINEQNDSHSSVHLSDKKTNFYQDEGQILVIIDKHDEESLDQNEDRTSNSSFVNNLPQIACLSLFAIIILVCIFDFKEMTRYFNLFILWVRDHPYQAVGAIILIYTLSIIFTIPQTATHIVIAFTYCQVF